MIKLWLFVLLSLPVFSQTRQDALKLAHTAAQQLTSSPHEAAATAEKAYTTLQSLNAPAPEDLAACAGLTARALRLAKKTDQARSWFRIAIQLTNSPSLRAELADLLMREGELAAARQALASPPHTPHAQWRQTSAKLFLTCGLPKKAAAEIELALTALEKDDFSNHAALHVDAAGIALRQNQSPTIHLEKAEFFLKKTATPDPEILSAYISVAAQNPALQPAEALTLLQGIPLSDLPEDARLTFSVTLAEAAARAQMPELVTQYLTNIHLPDDHPLLARSLALQGDPRSSEVALRWLEKSDLTDPEILLGLQRTVDPISPLIGGSLDTLAKTALTSQNFALRKKLQGRIQAPKSQTILYLIYEKEFTQHYAALLFTSEIKWIPLGPTDQIHQRIASTIETAERTLAEAPLGATLPVRLTQLWKSIWQPLSPHLDFTKPLYIAPAGMLHNIPWAILRDRDGRYLCQHFAQVRILSLTGEFPNISPGTQPLFCGTSMPPRTMPDLPPLPGVISELASLTQNPLLNPTKDQLMRAMKKRPKMIHLAGHGFVNDHGDFHAGLALKDDILYARDIVKLDLSSTQLVTLSACRGGIGQNEVGGNWSSLRRSFIAAGVPAVMAAQWRVRDDELPIFMKQFYQNLTQSSPSDSLWSLQKQWLEDPSKGSENVRVASAGAWVLEERE